MIERLDRNRRTRPVPSAAFRFDVASGMLWQGAAHVSMRAKTVAVLRYLLEHRGDVVSREELRRAVWGKRHGSEHGPKQCVRELRALLSDTAHAPRYIETVGQSGYRFVGEVELVAGAERGKDRRAASTPDGPICVGRESELRELDAALARAFRGERSTIFIAGEPGIGKTTLIDAFAGRFAGRSDLWLARGQCVPHDGPGEAYGPLLNIAEQLAAAPVRTLLVDLVRQAAPSVLAQMPATFDQREIRQRQIELAGAGPEQTLRQLVHVFEQMSQRLPGIIVLEDLHWADASTINWVSAWALQRMPARLLLIVSYRPGDSSDGSHSAGQMLAEIRRAPGFREIELSGLTAGDLGRWLDLRFPDNTFPSELPAILAQRTEGHALFATSIVQDWLERGFLFRSERGWRLKAAAAELSASVPESVQALIELQLSKLGHHERLLLERASAAGLDFSAAALAETADDVEPIERRCERLVNRQLLARRPEPARWPNGTVASSYSFRHALYRRAIYEAMPSSVRRRSHLQIGLRLENGYGKHASDIAPVLADHFEHGGDDRRATLYERKAGEIALSRGAAREAQERFRRALAHIARLRPGRARDTEEIQAQVGLGVAHILVEGFALPAVASAFERALALARRQVNSPTLVPTLAGLWNYRVTTGELKKAKSLATRLHKLVREKHPSGYAMVADNTLGWTSLLLGRFAAAVPYFNRVSAAYNVSRHRSLSILFGEDPGVVSHMCGAVTHLMLGSIEEAQRQIAAGTDIARALNQPFGRAQMLWADLFVSHQLGDPALVEHRARTLLAVCEEGGVDFWQPTGRIFSAWAQSELGNIDGLDKLTISIQAWRATAVRITFPAMLAIHAEACLRHGRWAEADEALNEALSLIRATGERWYEGEVHRLRGELLRLSGMGTNDEALEHFRLAARVARRQGARLLELRAVVSLAKLLETRGEHAQIERSLAPLRPLLERSTDLTVAREAQAILARLRDHPGRGATTH